MNKIRDSIELLWCWIEQSKRPAALLSFGKDSMVLADLIRKSQGRSSFPRVHGFPIDVIYHRDPWFPHKHAFANKIIESWGMEVHDFPPFAAGVKVKPDMLELVARYNFGHGALDIPKNLCQPDEYPRRDYICGLNDWLLRPKTLLYEYPWDCVFAGHRSTDVDPFEGPVPLRCKQIEAGGVTMVFPLKDWTDEEVWEYIRDEHIPVQKARYDGDEHWYGNDWMHACTACIDPRETRETVWCPKLKENVRNRGHEVLQLHERPDYIGSEANHG